MRGTEIASEVLKVLSPVLLAVITWVTARLAQLINARVKNEYLRGVLVRLDDTVASVVREIHQVTVDALKASSIDGKITPGARDTIKNAALTVIKGHLGAQGIGDVARVLGLSGEGVDRLIGTKIEAAVHDLKTQQRLMNGVHAVSPPGDALPLSA